MILRHSDASATADVIIIGAGILGAAAAHILATSGHRVVVLERGAPNREGSGTTAGNLHFQAIHTHRPGQAVAADNRRFLPYQMAASALWSSIEDELDCSVELRRSGGFMLAETPEQVVELQLKHKMENEHGLRTQLVTGAEARAQMSLLSERVLAADWCADDGYANPLLVTPAYLTSAARHGAAIHAFSPVTAIERSRHGYVVHSGERSWSTPNVINVAGPWLADVAALAGIRLAMTPVAIQMHVTARIPEITRLLIQHVGEGLSIKQTTSGNILVGGGWPAAQLNMAGRSRPSVASLSANLRSAVRILPFIADLQILRMWAGPLAATPDEMPVIGEVPGSTGFFVAGGTYAFTLAPLWATTLKALIEGTTLPHPIDDVDLNDRIWSASNEESTLDANRGVE